MEKKPDWESHGEPVKFYATCYPFPRTVLPELGKIETSDPEFNRLMKALIEDPYGSVQERRSAYEKYIKANTMETSESYLNHIKAMLVCGNHRWPEETWKLFEKPYREDKPKIQGLLEKIVPTEKDEILYRLGMLPLKHMQYQHEEALADVWRISPYLAVYGQLYLLGNIRGGSTSDRPDYIIELFKKNGLMPDLTVKPCVLYEWLRIKKWEKLDGRATRYLLIEADCVGQLYGPDGFCVRNPSLIRDAFGVFGSPDDKLRAGIEKNDKNMVDEALQEGADVKSPCGNFKNALDLATWWENVDVDIVKSLVEHGANPRESKPLLSAAMRGKLGTVTYLLEKGADVNAGDTCYTALMWASGKSFEITKLLIEKGADVNKRTFRTALIVAADSKQVETVKLLLDHGADVNAQDKYGCTALYEASSSWGRMRRPTPECLEIVKLLLEKGAHADIKNTDNGKTALEVAARDGQEAVVNLLLEKGAKPIPGLTD